MRLIDAEEAKEILKHLLYETAMNNSGGASLMCEDIAEYRLDTWVGLIPTIDAVEVVRCKDCSRHGTKSCPIKGKIKGNLAEEFYCQCGTPKADLAEWNALVKEVLNEID